MPAEGGARSVDQRWWPRDDLVRTIREQRARFDAVVASVPRPRLAEPGVGGGKWSVKDVLAHIAWGERETTLVMRARELVGSELWRLSDDERNAAVFEQERHRPLDDVLRDHAASHGAYMAALADLSDEDLNDPSRIRGMVPGWRPWRIFYDPEHYEHHRRDIEEWLERPDVGDVDRSTRAATEGEAPTP